jgi:hypothetical protein
VSDILFAEIVVASSVRAPAYWWPLAFEGARQAGFTYWHPHRKADHGSFFALDAKTLDELDPSTSATFPQMWDAVWHSATGDLSLLGPIVHLWADGSDPFEVWISVTSDSADGPLTLSFDLPIESLEYPAQRADYRTIDIARLRRYLAGVCAVYDLCRPCSVLLQWQKSEWEVGAINQAWSPPKLAEDYEDPSIGTLATMPLKDGSALSVLNPFPLPHYPGHDWLPLLDDESLSI